MNGSLRIAAICICLALGFGVYLALCLGVWIPAEGELSGREAAGASPGQPDGIASAAPPRNESPVADESLPAGSAEPARSGSPQPSHRSVTHSAYHPDDIGSRPTPMPARVNPKTDSPRPELLAYARTIASRPVEPLRSSPITHENIFGGGTGNRYAGIDTYEQVGAYDPCGFADGSLPLRVEPWPRVAQQRSGTDDPSTDPATVPVFEAPLGLTPAIPGRGPKPGDDATTAGTDTASDPFAAPAPESSNSDSPAPAEPLAAPVRPTDTSSGSTAAAESQTPPTSPASPQGSLVRIREDTPGSTANTVVGSAGSSAGEGTSGLTSAGSTETPAKTATATAGPSIPAAAAARANTIDADSDGRLSLRFIDEDIRSILETLAEYSGMNILAGSSVSGKMSFVLHDVTPEQALEAILRTGGYTARRDGRFIYVGTRQSFQQMEEAGDRVGTRIYRPNYISAAELQKLITPMLSPDVGSVSVSTASEGGISADSTNAGGDNYAGSEVVLVRDFECVLRQIDDLLDQVDIRPMQVAIEAMVLTVKLGDEDRFGVNFDFLRNRDTIKFGIGAPETTLANFKFEKGALKFGFLDSSLGTFVEALETIGDTDIIATPRVIALNKHRAEIQVGDQEGYIGTQSTTETNTVSSVEFLETGTILRFRPFISDDGIVRLEIHPELSTGSVETKNGYPLPQKSVTQVTTNIMVRDGCTVVIGGLLREQIESSVEQVPVLGTLPWLGPAFRSKTDKVTRQEVIVVITPRIIYEPGTCQEGDMEAAEFIRRHAVMAEKMTPLNKRSIARRYIRLAQNAWAAGDRTSGMRFAEMAVQFDPTSREAIELRSNIWQGRQTGDHLRDSGTLPGPPVDPRLGIPMTLGPEHPPLRPEVTSLGQGGGYGEYDQSVVSASPLDGPEIEPWLLDRIRVDSPLPSAPNHPYDAGRPGQRQDIVRPRLLQ